MASTLQPQAYAPTRVGTPAEELIYTLTPGEEIALPGTHKWYENIITNQTVASDIQISFYAGQQFVPLYQGLTFTLTQPTSNGRLKNVSTTQTITVHILCGTGDIAVRDQRLVVTPSSNIPVTITGIPNVEIVNNVLLPAKTEAYNHIGANIATAVGAGVIIPASGSLRICIRTMVADMNGPIAMQINSTLLGGAIAGATASAGASTENPLPWPNMVTPAGDSVNITFSGAGSFLITVTYDYV